MANDGRSTLAAQWVQGKSDANDFTTGANSHEPVFLTGLTQYLQSLFSGEETALGG